MNSKERPIPLLSILIVNYNGLHHLEECLSSIYAQNFNDYEVVLVDNASRDGSIEFLQNHFPEVRIIQAPANLGFAGGNNFGLPHCSGEYIFFLNNDTRMESGSLQGLADSFRKFPGYRVFACFLLKLSNPSLVDSAGDTIYKGGFITSFTNYPASLFTTPRDVMAACAGAAVYSRRLLDEIGAFDDDFFLIFEDVDLSLRARHHGESILFLPGVRILHKGSASVGAGISPTRVYFGTRNLFPLFMKNIFFLTICKCIPGILFIYTVCFFQAVRHGHARIFFRAVRDSLFMMPHMLEKRKSILSQTGLSRKDFEKLLRPRWFHERFAFKHGNFKLPI